MDAARCSFQAIVVTSEFGTAAGRISSFFTFWKILKSFAIYRSITEFKFSTECMLTSWITAVQWHWQATVKHVCGPPSMLMYWCPTRHKSIRYKIFTMLYNGNSCSEKHGRVTCLHVNFTIVARRRVGGGSLQHWVVKKIQNKAVFVATDCADIHELVVLSFYKRLVHGGRSISARIELRY